MCADVGLPPEHQPVLLDTTLALLAPALLHDDAVIVDATVGLGGHSESLLRAFPAARLVGVDRDPDALAASRERLADFADRVTLVHSVYDEMPEVLRDLGLDHADGILFDLGVSSMQLDRLDRGFSYRSDSPLDMRMDPTRGISAVDVLNDYPVPRLTSLIARYGEERFAGRIAEGIARVRVDTPIETSAQLVAIIHDAIPRAAQRTGGHPAKKTFQALRIEVNAELEVLARALPLAIGTLAVGGRIVVLSYHSLEDRIAKRVLADLSVTSAPRDLPVVPEAMLPPLRLLTRGAVRPDLAEVESNRRAASARLRAAERIRAAA